MMNKRKLIGLGWLGGAVFLAVLFAVGFSPFVKLTPWSAEKKLARLTNTNSLWKKCENKEGEASLAKLVKRIYPVKKDDKNFSIDVRVVRIQDVNAFATLGGEILVNQGLLEHATSPEELAGVLAHEIEHVRNRHILENVLVKLMTTEGVKILLSGDSTLSPDAAAGLLHMHFTKREESEADREGLLRLQMAEVSAQGFYNFFNRVEKTSGLSELFSDHPSDKERLDKVKPFLKMKSSPVLSEKEWGELQNICR